jgi:hypothetical protein
MTEEQEIDYTKIEPAAPPKPKRPRTPQSKLRGAGARKDSSRSRVLSGKRKLARNNRRRGRRGGGRRS